MTHRQYLTWQTWLGMQWERPSREDHYRMQVACEVRRTIVKDPSSPRIGDFKLRFETTRASRDSGSKGGTNKGLSRDQAAAMSKARWFMATGYTPTTTPADNQDQ
jgi:hypothetical protein